MRSAKAGMLCRWIYWCDMESFTYEPMGCCALEYNKAMDLVGFVSRLWSIPTTWRAKASCRELWAKTCMLARMLVGDDSWSSWWHEVVTFADFILWAWRIWGIEELRSRTLMQYGVHAFVYIYGCALESDLMWRIDMRHFGVMELQRWWCHGGNTWAWVDLRLNHFWYRGANWSMNMGSTWEMR